MSMFSVHALRSLGREHWYVGLTSGIQDRISRHQDGRERTTKPYRPLELMYLEKFPTRPEAQKKEKYLKSGTGKEWRKVNAIQVLDLPD